MTLPSSGALSMSQINTEFGRGLDLNSYRGTQWVTPQGGAGTFTSSNIGFNQFLNTQPLWYFGGGLYYQNFVSPFIGVTQTYYSGSFFVGPHQCTYISVQNRPSQLAYTSFPNGRPSTFCRLYIHGITDQTSSSWDASNSRFIFSYYGIGWGNSTRTTEVFLFN